MSEMQIFPAKTEVIFVNLYFSHYLKIQISWFQILNII